MLLQFNFLVVVNTPFFPGQPPGTHRCYMNRSTTHIQKNIIAIWVQAMGKRGSIKARNCDADDEGCIVLDPSPEPDIGRRRTLRQRVLADSSASDAPPCPLPKGIRKRNLETEKQTSARLQYN